MLSPTRPVSVSHPTDVPDWDDQRSSNQPQHHQQGSQSYSSPIDWRSCWSDCGWKRQHLAMGGWPPWIGFAPKQDYSWGPRLLFYLVQYSRMPVDAWRNLPRLDAPESQLGSKYPKKNLCPPKIPRPLAHLLQLSQEHTCHDTCISQQADCTCSGKWGISLVHSPYNCLGRASLCFSNWSKTESNSIKWAVSQPQELGFLSRACRSRDKWAVDAHCCHHYKASASLSELDTHTLRVDIGNPIIWRWEVNKPMPTARAEGKLYWINRKTRTKD